MNRKGNKRFTVLKLANNVHFNSLGQESKMLRLLIERTRRSNVCSVSRDAKEINQPVISTICPSMFFFGGRTIARKTDSSQR